MRASIARSRETIQPRRQSGIVGHEFDVAVVEALQCLRNPRRMLPLGRSRFRLAPPAAQAFR
jgi:hypothetical protein